MEKEPSEARRKKDNKQAEERKEKTSIQKHKTGEKKQQEYIQQEKQTKQNKLFTNLKLKTQEKESERQKREMVGGTQGRAVTRKEEEEEEGKDVGTRDQTASGTGALKRDKMQRGRKEETEKSVRCSHSLSHRKCLLVTSALGGEAGGAFFFAGRGFFSLSRPRQNVFSSPE